MGGKGYSSDQIDMIRTAFTGVPAPSKEITLAPLSIPNIKPPAAAPPEAPPAPPPPEPPPAPQSFGPPTPPGHSIEGLDTANPAGPGLGTPGTIVQDAGGGAPIGNIMAQAVTMPGMWQDQLRKPRGDTEGSLNTTGQV